MKTTTAPTPRRRDRRAFFLIAAVLAATLGGLTPAPAAASSTDLHVPAAVATIQGAIDAASDGDTVIVAPGTYHEHIDFKGKDIEVRSSDAPVTTTIDADGLTSVVRMVSGEGRAATLRGFTITGGLVDVNEFARTLTGGGVDIQDSSPTIIGNVITGNHGADHAGAGIGVTGGSPLIQSNHIFDNHAGMGGGGGGLIVGGDAEVSNNVIEGNSAGGGGGLIVFGNARIAGNTIRDNHAGSYDGGGVSIHEGTPEVVDNLITGNTADVQGGGIAIDPGVGSSGLRRVVGNTLAVNHAPAGSALSGELAGVQIVNNLVAGSVACSGPAIGAGTFHHNDVYDGAQSPYSGCAATSGNMSADPRFVNPAGPTPDFHLQVGSPAIDAGDPTTTAPAIDFSGHPRVTDGDGDGAAVIDIGVYESPRVFARHPQMPYSVWTQPSGAPLDGLGGWVYPLNVPAAAEGQLPPAYLYAQYFGFVSGGAVGQVGLHIGAGGRSGVFSVVEADGTAHNLSVPFAWSADHFYFPFVSQLGPGSWGGWVYDDAAATWTSIGTLALPAAWGKLAPASVTAVPWLGPTAGSCSRYPTADVLFYPPFGFVGGVGSVATLATTSVGPGDCAATTSPFGPWVRYQMGA